jgi:hypothetical protein
MMRHRQTLNPIREEFLLKGRVHGWPHFHSFPTFHIILYKVDFVASKEFDHDEA